MKICVFCRKSCVIGFNFLGKFGKTHYYLCSVCSALLKPSTIEAMKKHIQEKSIDWYLQHIDKVGYDDYKKYETGVKS